MEDTQFSSVLEKLVQGSKKRDPRTIRLAAVTSALVEVAGNHPSKVYASTISALERTLEVENIQDSLSTQVALLELLFTTIGYVEPPAILVATLPLSSRVLRAIVNASVEAPTSETKDELGGSNAVLRWTCKASTELLKRVEPATDEKTTKTFLVGTLMALMEDSRPKVRKAAHAGLFELLMTDGAHPVIRKTLNAYIQRELITSLKQRRTDGSILHLLGFLEHSIDHLNMTKIGDQLMEYLVALFQSDESGADFISVQKVKESMPRILTITSLLACVSKAMTSSIGSGNSEFASRVLATLIQGKPSLVFRHGTADEHTLQRGRVLYGEAMLTGCRCLFRTNSPLIGKLFPLSLKLVVVLSKPHEDDPEDATVAESLMVSVAQVVREEMGSLGSQTTETRQMIGECLRIALQTTDPDYRASWSVSLPVVIAFLRLDLESPQATDAVEALIQCHGRVPSGTSSQADVEAAFSSLVQGVGVEAVWPLILWSPSDHEAQENARGVALARTWILPAMKKSAMTAQPSSPSLAFFQSVVLDMARTCDRLAAASEKQRPFYHARVMDLWALFPCFCMSPRDVVDALPGLSTTLSRALGDNRYPGLIEIIASGIVNLSRSTAGSGNEESDAVAMSSAATRLLPVLFKLATSMGQSDTDHGTDKVVVDIENVTERDGSAMKAISEAVSALAVFAPNPFLQGIFRKLMHKLLEQVQLGSKNTSQCCALLSLSQALVSAKVLDDESVSFLYRALKPIIRDDEHGSRVQKRGYKALAEMCECHHSFFMDIDRLRETLELLSSTIMSSQVAARYMRLRCMNALVDGFDDSHSQHLEELMKVIAEVLLCLKDANGRTREASYQLLLSIAVRQDIADFVRVVAAGLGAETPHMRSAAVMALSRLVFELAWEDEALHELLPSMLQTVIVLFNENSREVVKSVVGFVRVSVAAIPSEQLEPLLPELVRGLLTYHHAKARFRSKIKIILKKLVKLYGYDYLKPLVPETEQRLLTHMRKLDERQKRRLNRDDVVDTFDAMLESDEEDSDDGRTLMTGATGFSRLTSRKGEHTPTKSGASRKTEKSTVTKKSPSSVLLNEGSSGDVVDMLDTRTAKRVIFAEDENNDSDSDVDMEFDDDGKLVVRDDVEDEEPVPEEPANKKRRTSKYETEKAKQNQKQRHDLGAAYKSKRAGGDVKRKNQKFEPYAFVPLDGRSYSKKNRREAVNQMSSVVRGATKRKRR